MSSFLYALVALLVVAHVAVDAKKVFPEVGDLGSMTRCVPSDDDAADECRTCAEEREEKADEDADADGDEEFKDLFVEKCIDACSSLYMIEQLPNLKVTDKDGNVEEYRQIELIPGDSCIDGCQCPRGIGTDQEAVEEEEEYANDDAVEYPEMNYDLIFYNRDGSVDVTGFTGGLLSINYGDDEAPKANQVSLQIYYYVTEVNDKEEEERVLEDCQVDYTIQGGSIGGIKGEGSTPSLPSTPDIAQLGAIELKKTYPEECASFAEGSFDECFYLCAKEFQVQTLNDSVVFIPKLGAISATCRCIEGQGFQDGYGDEFEKALGYFAKDTSGFCSSTFNANNISTIVAKNALFDDAPFTISYTSSEGTSCTFAYEVVSGEVLNVAPISDDDEVKPASQLEVIMCIVVTAVILIAFAVPSCLPKNKNYQPVH